MPAGNKIGAIPTPESLPMCQLWWLLQIAEEESRSAAMWRSPDLHQEGSLPQGGSNWLSPPSPGSPSDSVWCTYHYPFCLHPRQQPPHHQRSVKLDQRHKRPDTYHVNRPTSAIDLTISTPGLALRSVWEVVADTHGSDHYPILTSILPPVAETQPSSPPRVLLLCRSWGACVPRRPQRLCQLEFWLLVGLTMLDRLCGRGQTKCNTPLMLATSAFGRISQMTLLCDVPVKVQAGHSMAQWRGMHGSVPCAFCHADTHYPVI